MIIHLPVTKEQIEFINCRCQYISLIAGRRWGKSFAIAYRIIARACDPKYRGWYIAPQYSQTQDVFDLIANNNDIQPFIKKVRRSGPFPQIEFTTGATIGFRSFDRNPQALRGGGLSEVYIDEVQNFEERSFWSVIRPLLSDRRGTLIIAGQFRGKNWYYEKLYLPGISGYHRKDNYKSFCHPTSSGIKFQSVAGKAELEEVQRQIPRIQYDQEYNCIPTANEDAVFRHEDLQDCMGGEVLKQYRNSQGYNYIHALDLGRVVDPSSHIVLEIPPNGRPMVCFSQERPLKERHEDGAIVALKINKDFTPPGQYTTILIDTTGGATGGNKKPDQYIQYYRNSLPTMRPVVFTAQSKKDMVESLMLAIEQNKIIIPKEHEELHKQLSLYEYKIKPSGLLEYGVPRSVGHDDLVSALMSAWYGYCKGYYRRSSTGSGSVI